MDSQESVPEFQLWIVVKAKRVNINEKEVTICCICKSEILFKGNISKPLIFGLIFNVMTNNKQEFAAIELPEILFEKIISAISH